MREIKFRGKNFYTGQWEFGDLETCPTDDFCRIHRYKEDGTYNLQAKVVKNTVGQFTGLKDKNENEIYEKCELDGKYIVMYMPPKFVGKDVSNNNIIDLYDNKHTITKEYCELSQNA